MKNKKIIIIISILLILGLGVGFTYYFLMKEDKVTTLNLFEKQWIETNRNNVIDMSIINDVPIFSYNGEGVIVDFLNSLNKETGLSFNKVSYKVQNDVKSAYSFQWKDEKEDRDVLIYTDNYVLVTKENKKFHTVADLKDMKIGVLSQDMDKVNHALFNSTVSYQAFENKEQLLFEFENDATTLEAIVLLKVTDLKTIFDNDYTIAYNINDCTKSLVLSLGETERLNAILTKYYKKWANENYEESYHKYLSKNYFSFKNINDSESVKFRSKRYVYGYIENAPFDTTLSSKLAGMNSKLLVDFSRLTNAEISYKAYDNMKDLLLAFNTNQIDFFYGIHEDTNYAMDVYPTASIYDNHLVILKHSSNPLMIDSIHSLKKASVLQNTKVQAYLQTNGIETNGYANMQELMKSLNEDSIIVMDLYNYHYYHDQLKSYFMAYQMNMEDASFIVRDIQDNHIFRDFLDFYLHFYDTDTFVSLGLQELIFVNKTPMILRYVALVLGSFVSILLVVLAIIKLKPKKKVKVNFSKEDKLRYIDALTSLKNRNYLNDSLEKWDNSEVYPQTIIIADLNNVAYINDNYGHAEGDAVIKQAASILIVNQIENSEMIRTNGNEFLIYLVGYEEKQVITYMRKLSKEFKELNHGFGAALGYSMIHDAIKTIDDAINEATLDMRNNKEEANH